MRIGRFLITENPGEKIEKQSNLFWYHRRDRSGQNQANEKFCHIDGGLANPPRLRTGKFPGSNLRRQYGVF